MFAYINLQAYFDIHLYIQPNLKRHHSISLHKYPDINYNWMKVGGVMA